MKEVNKENLDKLHKFVTHFPKEKDGHTFTVEEAIILGIFGVFNPENTPMSEEKIQEYFDAYVDFVRKTYLLN